MRVHFDVLGWLYILSGVLAALTGASLLVLASGTHAAHGTPGQPGVTPTVWFLAFSGVIFALAGALSALVGRAVVRRAARARSAALALAVPALIVMPFGTALAVYTFWTLVNDDARREFAGAGIRPAPRRHVE